MKNKQNENNRRINSFNYSNNIRPNYKRQRTINNISELQDKLKEEELKLKSICSAITNCHNRAIEQGCLGIL